MSPSYPDLYIPSGLQKAQEALPPVPPSPSEPHKPGSPPQRLETGTIITFGIGTIVISLLTQSFTVFFLGLILTIVFGAYSFFSFLERLTGYEEKVRQYENNYQKFLVARKDYDREVKLIRSEENIYKYRVEASAKVLQNLTPYPPDGRKSSAQTGASEAYFYGYLTRYFSKQDIFVK